MPLGNHEVRLVDQRVLCADVAVFGFERPASYEFTPGQYLMLRLDVPEGPAAKPFSHASGPGDDVIEIATRLSGSTFKSALSRLQPGDVAQIGGPMGAFVLPDAVGPVLFLVGGVGITPVRSMLRDAAASNPRFDAVLLYGNRSPACAPFAEELASLRMDGLRVVNVFESGFTNPNDEKGFITSELVARHVPDFETRLFATAGPPVMVEAMISVLDELAIPQGLRLVERFGVRSAPE